MKNTTAKWAGRFARLAIFAILVAWLAQRLDVATLREVGRNAMRQPLWISGGVLFMLLTSFAAALRWRGLLGTQGVVLPTSAIMRIFFIGQFFNSFMLGACGGDMVRIYYVLRGTTARRTEAATTVLIDRGIGICVQILLGCLLILVNWALFRAHATLQTAALLMFSCGAGTALLVGALLWKNLFEHFALFRRLEQATPLGARFRRAYEELLRYRQRPRALMSAFFFSILNLLFQVIATASLGRSLGLHAAFGDYLVFLPIISVLTAIPLTPGSFGVREGLFVLLFQAVGVSAHHAVLLSLLFYAAALVWSLVGGLVFLGHSAGAGFNWREELARIRQSGDENSVTP
ncbi:MAG: flippase-like domain-containing protein [Verrucomicrobia bacterium]|nr:MAG: flippase-like domain-containing protein [Verrucomicrobiota bacterium]